MTNLYIWYRTINRTPKGVPQFEDRWLRERFNHSGEQEGFDYTWLNYNPNKDKFPPQGELKFPSELFFIVQKQKELQFDLLNYQWSIYIVSGKFLNLIAEYRPDLKYEIANLKVVHRNEKELKHDQLYFAIRISSFDDNLFEFVEEGKKRASGVKGFFLYPNMKLKDGVENKSLYFLNEFCYNETIIIDELLKDKLKEEFYSPEIYRLADFAQLYNNRYKVELMPQTV